MQHSFCATNTPGMKGVFFRMQIETIPIQNINPAPYNPRKDLKPGDPMYERLKGALTEFGCVEPLVWNRRTGNLVGGHQRLKVLKEQGVDSVQVSVVDLSPEKEKALNLALNKITGDWDEQKLAELLDELVDLPDFDLELTGFDVAEATDLIAEFLSDPDADQEEQFDVDAALDAAGEPVTQPGDLIQLGDHRLLCGDATDREQVRRLMDGHKAVLFATDPPYLVGYDGTNHPGSRPRKGRPRKGRRPGQDRPTGPQDGDGGGPREDRPPKPRSGNAAHTPEGRKDWSGSYGVTWDDADANPDLYNKFIAAAVAEALDERAAWYCWHASRNQGMLEQAWQKHGVLTHCQIIWTKNKGVPTRTWYLWQHEPCLMGWRKGNMPKRVQRKRLPTVWQFNTLPNGSERPDHPTPKPLEVFEIPMRQHTCPGDICYEPFAGSGTQVIAAQRLKRRCFALEISPRYCDLIVRRFIAFAGEKAVAPAVAEKYRLPISTEEQK